MAPCCTHRCIFGVIIVTGPLIYCSRSLIPWSLEHSRLKAVILICIISDRLEILGVLSSSHSGQIHIAGYNSLKRRWGGEPERGTHFHIYPSAIVMQELLSRYLRSRLKMNLVTCMGIPGPTVNTVHALFEQLCHVILHKRSGISYTFIFGGLISPIKALFLFGSLFEQVRHSGTFRNYYFCKIKRCETEAISIAAVSCEIWRRIGQQLFRFYSTPVSIIVPVKVSRSGPFLEFRHHLDCEHILARADLFVRNRQCVIFFKSEAESIGIAFFKADIVTIEQSSEAVVGCILHSFNISKFADRILKIKRLIFRIVSLYHIYGRTATRQTHGINSFCHRSHFIYRNLKQIIVILDGDAVYRNFLHLRKANPQRNIINYCRIFNFIKTMLKTRSSLTHCHTNLSRLCADETILHLAFFYNRYRNGKNIFLTLGFIRSENERRENEWILTEIKKRFCPACRIDTRILVNDGLVSIGEIPLRFASLYARSFRIVITEMGNGIP